MFTTAGESLKPVADLLRDRTRSNALTLSTGARENVPELLIPYRFFRDHIQVYDMSSFDHELLKQATQICRENEQLYSASKLLLNDADTGVDDVRIVKTYMIDEEEAPPTGSIDRVTWHLESLRMKISPPEITTSRSGTNGEAVAFDFVKDESNGTQRFFALAALFLNALETGAFLAVDELDASMHPLLSRKLLELFQSVHANPNGAQLLFTTHDPSLLDQVLFRRDQIWLAEKRDGGSMFFSLADVEPPPRNTEAFLRNYLSGRYGGTPHLGRAFDTLKIGAAK